MLRPCLLVLPPCHPVGCTRVIQKGIPELAGLSNACMAAPQHCLAACHQTQEALASVHICLLGQAPSRLQSTAWDPAGQVYCTQVPLDLAPSQGDRLVLTAFGRCTGAGGHQAQGHHQGCRLLGHRHLDLRDACRGSAFQVPLRRPMGYLPAGPVWSLLCASVLVPRCG